MTATLDLGGASPFPPGMGGSLNRTDVRHALFPALLLVFFLPPSWVRAKGAFAAAPSNYEMVEAPTAYTLLHGGYDVVLRQYEGGGVFLRGNIGFQERVLFGFSLNASNVVGQGDIEVQHPRLGLKVKVFDEKRFPLSLAAGWDDRGYGTDAGGGLFTPGLQKRFYVAASREFEKAGYLQVHGGANVLRFQNFDGERDLGFFTGVSFALARELLVNVELDKLFTDGWQFNGNFLMAFDDPVRIGVDFRDLNHSDRFARILRIQYLSFF